MKDKSGCGMVIFILICIVFIAVISDNGKSEERYRNSPNYERDMRSWVVEHWDELNP